MVADSLMMWVLKIYGKTFLKRDVRNRPIAKSVRHWRTFIAYSPLLPLKPFSVSKKKFQVGSLSGIELSVAEPKMAILYLHGGAYIGGHPRVYVGMQSRFAKRLQAKSILLDYRLAPEHPYPAALDDSLAAYQHLLDEGFAPDNIVLMGDSAGGGLVLSSLLAIKDRQMPMPRCVVSMSPLTDFSGNAKSILNNRQTDCILGDGLFELMKDCYVNGADISNPYLSTCLGDYRNTCPILITCSEIEILYDDGVKVYNKAKSDGAAAQILTRPNAVHIWPAFTPYLPEANEDVQTIFKFIEDAAAAKS